MNKTTVNSRADQIQALSWKQIKNTTRKFYKLGCIDIISVYEIDYNHVFFNLDSMVVYDVIDHCAYRPQTGIV